MNTDVLNIGDKIIIKKKARKDESEYTSQIQEIDGKKIRMLTPMYKSVLIRLQEKTRIELLVYGTGKVYFLEAEVVETIVEDNLYYTDIIAVSEVEKMERRNYFRVRTMKDILIRVKDQENPQEYEPALTIDLSGGGIMFSSTYEYLEDTEIEIKMTIDDSPVILSGKVLNKEKQQELRSYKYTVKFIDLDSSIKEKIITHVFKLQREALQK